MQEFLKLDSFIQDYLPNLQYTKNEELSIHTSMRIGGTAARFACPTSKEEFILLSEFAYSEGIKPIIIGNGSNTVFGNHINRLIISTKNLTNVHVINTNYLVVDCGTNLAYAATIALDNSLTGMEFAHGIPGSMGGALFMNAGAYGGEMKDIIDSATIYIPTIGIKKYSVEDLKLNYRYSVLQSLEDAFVLDVTIKLHTGEKDIIKSKMIDLMERRKNKQPLEYPSAGSFFKRPDGYFAGALIEDAGLKGYSVGDVCVSDKHAGFIINKGNGSYEDLIRLMKYVQDTVYRKYGVKLEPEVRIIH